jgi:hypothetical protein
MKKPKTTKTKLHNEKAILVVAAIVFTFLTVSGQTSIGKNVGMLLSSVSGSASDDTAYTGELKPSAPIFTDISDDHPNAEDILYLKTNKIMTGYSDGSFGPDKQINRAELMKTIMVAVGMPAETASYKNCFSDVTDQWFAQYVCYAKSQRWISGYSNGTFLPGNDVSRAEAIKMVIAVKGITLETTPYGDAFRSLSPNLWYSTYVWTAEKSGLMNSWKDNTATNLGNKATRLEVATAIYRAIFKDTISTI